eukprot:RCo042058
MSEVDADPSVVQLRDPRADPRPPGEPIGVVQLLPFALHSLNDGLGLVPRGCGLVGLSRDSHVEKEVTDVRDGESKVVAPAAIALPTVHPAVLPGEGHDGLPLHPHRFLRALQHQRRSADLHGVETVHAIQEEFHQPVQEVTPKPRLRPQRRPEPELKVVHQPHAGRQHAGLREVIKELDSRAEVPEHQGAVVFHLGLRVHPEGGLGDHPHRALIAEQELVRLHSGRDPREARQGVDDPGRRGQSEPQNNVLDVPIAVLLHPTGVGGDPTAQRAHLHAVRLVARGEALAAQLFLQNSPRDPRLHHRGEVHGVHGEHLVHPP